MKKMPSVGLLLLVVFGISLGGVGIFKYSLSNNNSSESNVWVRLSKVETLFWPEGQNIDGASMVAKSAKFIELARGKIVLVHFWASWCAPCEDELPEIIKFASDFPSDKPLLILAVSLDKNWDASKKMLPPVLPSRWVNVLDTNHEFAEGLGSYQYPETLVIVDGQVQVKWVGAQAWSSPDWRAEFSKWFKRGMGGAHK